jgi:sugar phosphate isomerase/epimerase
VSTGTDSLRRRLGFRTSGLGRLSLQEALHGIRECGFELVEFCLEHPCAARLSADPGAVAGLVELAAACGLTPSSLSYHGKADPPEKRREFISCAFDAADIAGTRLVVCGSPAGPPGSAAEIGDLARQIMEPLERAGGRVSAAMEPEPGTVISSLDDWRRLDALAGGCIDINLDTGHLLLTEPDFAGALLDVAGRIVHFHVDDVRPGIHHHLVPGTGSVPWDAVRGAASTCGAPLVVDLFRLPAAPWGLVRRSLLAALEVLSPG